MAVAVAIIVAALAAVLLGRAGVFSTSPSAGSGRASTAWQTYHDPFSLFTLRLPPGWTAQVEPITTSYGDSRSGSVTVRDEVVTVDDPAQGTGSAHVWINVDPIETALARQIYCQDSANLTSFSARTLSTMEQNGPIWLFTTENASFQVDVAIPGVLAPEGHGPPPPAATPIPAAWAATDKSEVNAMLVSFQPTDPKPLVC